MPESAPPQALELAPRQGIRLWIALWLALGAFLVAGALLLVTAEVLLALKQPLLEALFFSRAS